MEHILLVEDNEMLRGVLVEILQQFGFCVHPAADGPAALSLARELGSGIDLVISDLVMPGMNALQLHDALQQLNYSGKMLIITGYPMPNTGASLVARPNVTWARKPIRMQELQLILAQLLTTRPAPNL